MANGFNKLPLYFTPRMLSELMGPPWSTRRVRRWLQRAGAIENRYGTNITTIDTLAGSFPELYRRMLERDDDED